jgi:O-antigen ligase
MPFIIANPLTGHGFDMGAIAIGNGNAEAGYTVDSYPLSLLVETGLIGFCSFIVMLFGGIVMGARRYLTDSSEAGPMNGALACAIVSFTVYRLVLSQRENHMLLFVILGLLIVSAAVRRRGSAPSPASRSMSSSARRAGSPPRR